MYLNVKVWKSRGFSTQTVGNYELLNVLWMRRNYRIFFISFVYIRHQRVVLNGILSDWKGLEAICIWDTSVWFFCALVIFWPFCLCCLFVLCYSFGSYLYIGHQRVVLNGILSDWKGLEAGVPQGPALGPLLCLVYINNLPGNIKDNMKLFAQMILHFSFVCLKFTKLVKFLKAISEQ